MATATFPTTSLPKPNQFDGLSLVGNFAGPGWSGSFKTRPTDEYDLVAKLHDAAFELNSLEVLTLPTAWAKKSRGAVRQRSKEHADAMFRRMTEYLKKKGIGSTLVVDFVARAIFDGATLPADGTASTYRNVLTSPWIDRLSNPNDYLMIPYSALRAETAPTKMEQSTAERLHHRPARVVPDYLAMAPEDTNPGFKRWLQTRYSEIWHDLISL